MTFARYFNFWSYCLISTGFIALAATGSVDLPSVLFFGSALMGSLFFDPSRLRRKIPSWLLNSLSALYPIVYFIDYRYYSRSFILSTIHLIFFVAALKILTRTTDRDYGFLYLLSFAELLAACTLTIDFTFAFPFFIFLLAAVSTLILFEMRRSNARAQSQGRVQPLIVRREVQDTGLELMSPFPAWTIFGLSLSINLTTLLLTIPLFLVLPRLSLGIYSRRAAKTQLVSGFSERVRLGEIGTIKQSDAIVMRVRMVEPSTQPPDNLKWRGIALDYYDGRSWARLDTRRRMLPPDGRYFQLENTAQGTDLLWQVFYVEALSTNVVFAAHKVMAVTNDLPFLQQDAAGNLFTRGHTSNKIRYSALSELKHPDPSLIPDDVRELPRAIQGCCLQLPKLDPRIAVLAREAVGSQRNPYQKARALERFLKSTYGYSLDLKGTGTIEDPLAMFLFDVRRGHCEYFATAMAIMLRQVGIPSRLVNGFRAGEYNTLGGGWIVRQYDAHSWVEGYLPPYGWLEFDPTPSDPARPKSRFGILLARYIEAFDLWWSDEIINYDIWKQLTLFVRARSKWVESLERGRQIFWAVLEKIRAGMVPDRLFALLTQDTKRLYFSIAFAGLLVCLFCILRGGRAARLIRILRRRMGPTDAKLAIAGFYAEALQLLESRGFPRTRGQTPLEFARSLQGSPVGELLLTLTGFYYRIRFGINSEPEDYVKAQHSLRALRLSLRRRQS
jgi:transglutaminase-like putative cysteine protease